MLLLEHLQILCVFHSDFPIHFKFSPCMQDCVLTPKCFNFTFCYWKLRKRIQIYLLRTRQKKKKKDSQNLYFGMPEAKKVGLLVLNAWKLVFPRERAATAVGIPCTLLYLPVCYFWLIFSEYYFCYLLFSVSVVLKAVLTPIIILSKEWTEISNKPKDLKRLWKHVNIKMCKLKALYHIHFRCTHIPHTPDQYV